VQSENKSSFKEDRSVKVAETAMEDMTSEELVVHVAN
jgi:hypothetical protein